MKMLPAMAHFLAANSCDEASPVYKWNLFFFKGLVRHERGTMIIITPIGD